MFWRMGRLFVLLKKIWQLWLALSGLGFISSEIFFFAKSQILKQKLKRPSDIIPTKSIDHKIKFTLKHCPQRSPDLWKMKNLSPGSVLELGRRGILTCCRCPRGLDIKALLVVRPLVVLAFIILWSKTFRAQFNKHPRKPFRCLILSSTPLD